MKAVRALVWICILVGISLGSIGAQQLQTRISSKTVAMGEQFRVQYVSSDQMSDFKYAPFPDFDIVAGPSQSSSYRSINGKTTAEISISFVLKPKKQGTFEIPQATAKIKGKKVSSSKVSVEVVAMSEATKRKEQAIKEKIYVKVDLSRTSCYQGEAVLASYKFYSAYNLANINIKELPSINGCWSKDVVKEAERSFKIETIGGVRYQVATVLKQLIIPQTSGKIELPPASIEVVAQIPTGRRTFFGDETSNRQMTITSARRALNVKALPTTGRPSDYSGAVGSFTMSNVLSVDTANVNDAISLNQTLNGKGNLSLFSLPKLVTPTDIELFEPKENDRVSATVSGMSGSKEIQNVLIPRNPGVYKISTPAFSFFDPTKEQYVSLPLQEFTLAVTGAQGEGGSLSSRSTTQSLGAEATKQKVGRLSSAILDVAQTTSLKRHTKPLYNSAAFKWLWWIPVLLGWVLYAFSYTLSNRSVDLVAQKQKKAKSAAVKLLKEARKLEQSADEKTYYSHLNRVLKQFLLEKLNLKMSDMTEADINEHLSSRNVNEGTIKELKTFFNDCQMATYGLGGSSNRGQMINRAEELINQLESQL